MNNSFNNGNSSSNIGIPVVCGSDVIAYIPSSVEFFELLGVNGWILLFFSTLALVIVIIVFIVNLNYVLQNVQDKFKFSTGTVLTVHPMIALCMYLEIWFPRSNVMLDACAHLWFVVCMLQFFRLTFDYFGGEETFLTVMSGKVLPWRKPPCCCWPCVWPCLPKEPVNKKQLRMIRILVIQHPFIQAVVSIITIAFYLEGWYHSMEFSPKNTRPYLNILATISFSFALWAFIVTFKSCRKQLEGFCYFGKTISFQLSLVFFRLQSLIFNIILTPSGVFPCLPPLSPRVMANFFLCCLVLGQMVVLSVLAFHYYRTSEDDKKHFQNGSSMDKIQKKEEQPINAIELT